MCAAGLSGGDLGRSHQLLPGASSPWRKPSITKIGHYTVNEGQKFWGRGREDLFLQIGLLMKPETEAVTDVTGDTEGLTEE